MDGDGYDDIAVGAPYEYDSNYNNTGFVRVFSGSSGSEINTFYGSSTYTYFGQAVWSAGDLDEDGAPDLFVGEPSAYDSASKTSPGAVYSFSVASGKIITTTYGPQNNAYFGNSVAGLGDINGDGLPDLGVGAPYNNNYSGSAFIYITPAPSGTVVINAGAVATATTDVNLGLTWKAGSASVKNMRVRNAGANWGSWIALADVKDWTLTAGEGEKVVEAQFIDVDGLVSKVVSDSIILDTSVPTGSIQIEGGAAWANSTTVDVDLQFTDAVSDVSDVRLRMRGDNWGPWIPYTGSATFEMASGDGNKVVEAQARDFAQNLSAVASDNIGLDMAKPVAGSIVLDGGYPYSGDWTVSAAFTAVDNAGGSGIASMALRRFDETTYRPWEPFVSQMELTLNSGEGVRGFFVQFRDLAGNVSTEYYDSIIIDISPPTVLEFTVTGKYAYFVAGSEFLVRAFAQDNQQGSGVASLRATFDDGVNFTEWVPYSSVGTSVTAPVGAGYFAVRIQLVDRAGNVSGLSMPASVYLVEAPPPYLGMSGSFTGKMSSASDVDVVVNDLIAGDLVTVTVKSRSAATRQALPVTIHMLDPYGHTSSVTPGLAFAIPKDGTGRYLFELTQQGAPGGAGDYSLKVSVKRPKSTTNFSRALKPNSDGEVEFVFYAADLVNFDATFTGGGVTPGTVRMRGPDGNVPFLATGGANAVHISATFNQSVGLYRVIIAATGPVQMLMGAIPPKKAKLYE